MTAHIDKEEVRRRFEAKVDKTGDCWLWTGSLTHDGYGYLSYHGRKRAHRLALELSGQGIPNGMVVDHICRTRNCVNPAHLRVVGPRTNTLENSAALTAINKRKTHCARGHKFTPENTRTRIKSDGVERVCRICNRDHVRRHRARYAKEAANG